MTDRSATDGISAADQEIGTKLRVVVADDERPVRAFLIALLVSCADVTIVGEAANGTEAVEVIDRERPDLAFLDLQMPELDGLGVVRLLRKDRVPLVAFVTAYDEYAVRAFEMNAIDYLLKPIDAVRLRHSLTRAHEWLDRVDRRQSDIAEQQLQLAAATTEIERTSPLPQLRRIPVRRRDDVILIPVSQVAAVIADGELLHIVTRARERHTITYRLKDLEARLDPAEFVRLSRGTLVSVECIQKVSPMPGGTYVVALTTGHQFQVSRMRARTLRDQLLRL